MRAMSKFWARTAAAERANRDRRIEGQHILRLRYFGGMNIELGFCVGLGLRVEWVDGIDEERLGAGVEFEVEGGDTLEAFVGQVTEFGLATLGEGGGFDVGTLALVGCYERWLGGWEAVAIEEAGGVAEVGGGMAGVGFNEDGLSGDGVFGDERLLHFEGFAEGRLIGVDVAAGDDDEGRHTGLEATGGESDASFPPGGHGLVGTVRAGAGDDDGGVFVLAAVGGLFLGQLQIASTELEGIGLLALPAVVIGGMQSIPGAIVGGLLVGIIEQMASTYISPKSSDIVIYVLLLLILMVRPWGLFGQRELGRV